jgi:vacuolar-type H+-ATPase subunit H
VAIIERARKGSEVNGFARRSGALAVCLAIAAGGLGAGCGGDDVNKAVDQAQEKGQKAIDQAQDKGSKAIDDAQKTLPDNAQKKINEAQDKAGEAVNTAADKANTAVKDAKKEAKDSGY